LRESLRRRAARALPKLLHRNSPYELRLRPNCQSTKLSAHPSIRDLVSSSKLHSHSIRESG